jgi:hypothetical protein
MRAENPDILAFYTFANSGRVVALTSNEAKMENANVIVMFLNYKAGLILAPELKKTVVTSTDATHLVGVMGVATLL